MSKYRDTKLRISKERRKDATTLLRAYKARSCLDCGVQYPYYVMQLDHRDPNEKILHPGNVPAKGWSRERMLAEYDKCDVVCANCHAVRTHQRRLVLNSTR